MKITKQRLRCQNSNTPRLRLRLHTGEVCRVPSRPQLGPLLDHSLLHVVLVLLHGGLIPGDERAEDPDGEQSRIGRVIDPHRGSWDTSLY